MKEMNLSSQHYTLRNLVELSLREKKPVDGLSWMVPFPGNWHFLKNYQEVLLKIYLDVDLRDLAKASGYQPNSVDSNFKRTHHFLLEAW